MLETEIDLFWEIKSLSSMNERKGIGIFRFFKQFSKIWKIGERYKADRIRERAEPCPTPTSML